MRSGTRRPLRIAAVPGLCWQDPSVCCYAWQDAIDYCDGLDFGGHTDWVLPTRQDFVDLLGGCDSAVTRGENSYCRKCSESGNCGSMLESDVGWYWSSSSNRLGGAWGVGFDGGGVTWGSVDNGLYVRCVR